MDSDLKPSKRISKAAKSLLIPDSLDEQVRFVIDKLEEYNVKRSIPRFEKDYNFLRDFFPRFIADHNNRSSEIRSSQYRRIVDLAKKQFSHLPYWAVCVDGRVLLILMHGATAGLAHAIRVPGGILKEFVPGKNGRLKLLKDSNFATLVEKALESSPDGIINEVFDSHIGCAARNAEEISRGRIPQDFGLLNDIQYKKQMIVASHDFIRENFGESKHAIAIQTSFDPHTGYMYMGLETPEALEYALSHGGEYTEKVVDELRSLGLIIDTADFVADPIFAVEFIRHDFSLSWKSHYVASAEKFWKAIVSMRSKLLPIIKKRLTKIYQRLHAGDGLAQEELSQRAMLLLTNAFSGYLENNHPEKNSHHQGEHGSYSYGIHEEEGVKVSEGGYSPYAISMFGVFSLNQKNLPRNLEIAAALVRGNRRDERVLDRSGNYEEAYVFAQAPVPVAMLELIREDWVTEDDWEAVVQADFSDLAKIAWEKMTDEEFDRYIQTKGKMTHVLVSAIKRLRSKLLEIYDTDRSISHHLLNHDLVVLPMLMDISRQIRTVIPFVKLGFD